MNRPAIVTFIVPVYNEAEVIPAFAKEMEQMIEGVTGQYQFEFLFIDDGSIDSTVESIRDEFENYPHTILSYSREYPIDIEKWPQMPEQANPFLSKWILYPSASSLPGARAARYRKCYGAWGGSAW